MCCRRATSATINNILIEPNINIIMFRANVLLMLELCHCPCHYPTGNSVLSLNSNNTLVGGINKISSSHCWVSKYKHRNQDRIDTASVALIQIKRISLVHAFVLTTGYQSPGHNVWQHGSADPRAASNLFAFKTLLPVWFPMANNQFITVHARTAIRPSLGPKINGLGIICLIV